MSHSARKCKKGEPLGFFEHPFCCKKTVTKKLEGDPLKTFKKLRKNVSQSRNNMHEKNVSQGRDSTWQTSKVLINFYAKWRKKLH